MIKNKGRFKGFSREKKNPGLFKGFKGYGGHPGRASLL